jgi:hypothetical protein
LGKLYKEGSNKEIFVVVYSEKGLSLSEDEEEVVDNSKEEETSGMSSALKYHFGKFSNEEETKDLLKKNVWLSK